MFIGGVNFCCCTGTQTLCRNLRPVPAESLVPRCEEQGQNATQHECAIDFEEQLLVALNDQVVNNDTSE